MLLCLAVMRLDAGRTLCVAPVIALGVRADLGILSFGRRFAVPGVAALLRVAGQNAVLARAVAAVISAVPCASPAGWDPALHLTRRALPRSAISAAAALHRLQRRRRRSRSWGRALSGGR